MSKICQLKSVTVRDFRSIGGQITVPLDAPVVLLHGLNGAGKTSVLSALELALTGAVDSMRRADPTYLRHLVHRGATDASVSLEVSYVDGSVGTWSRASSEKGWASESLLTPDDAVFYRERSYLAQATLGRLLEIYGTNEPTQGSALTRFVNDVLGLDTLEALIDGLSPAKDLRNTRTLVPEISDLELESRSLSSQVAQVRQQAIGLASTVQSMITQADAEIATLTQRLGTQQTEALITSELSADSDEADLVALAGSRREVDSMTKRLQAAEETTAGSDLMALERRSSEAALRLEKWRASQGARIERILDDVRSEILDLPSTAEVGPAETLDVALSRVTSDLERTTSLLMLDERLGARIDDLERSLEAASSRRAIVNEQLAEQVSGSGDVARLLSELIPHLHGDSCVVCGRDFSEVSEEPLAAFAARRASAFSAQAARVSELTELRSAVVSEIAEVEDEIKATKARLLESSDLAALTSRRADFEEWRDRLSRYREAAEVGTAAIRESNEARHSVVIARDSAEVWIELENSLRTVALDLGLAMQDTATPLEIKLRQAGEEIRSRIENLEARVSSRRRLIELSKAKDAAAAELAQARTEEAELEKRSLLTTRKSVGLDRARDQAKAVLKIAIETQGSVVRKVFNESLNAVWRDLFVRLAPNEPFVPAFHVQHGARDTKPQLVTMHRSGGEGGSPGSMLSSGNLNTAALTLFLALHLSSGDRMPVLVLDDPVQSMDDVHISQFAALLRTLSKQHGRQILVAVHERALFDYLSLELSPAFEGDSLITVEIGKHADGSTMTVPTYIKWREDPVRAAG
jgi:exonuclease SbcC